MSFALALLSFVAGMLAERWRRRRRLAAIVGPLEARLRSHKARNDSPPQFNERGGFDR